jgi:hypothetical protein
VKPRKSATAASALAEGDRRRSDQLGGSIGTEAKANGPKTQRRDRTPRAIDLSNALGVYDGQNLCGFIRSVDGHHLAYGPDHALIGTFGKFLDAMRSLPGGMAS